jgi:hypothetical protein
MREQAPALANIHFHSSRIGQLQASKSFGQWINGRFKLPLQHFCGDVYLETTWHKRLTMRRIREQRLTMGSVVPKITKATSMQKQPFLSLLL